MKNLRLFIIGLIMFIIGWVTDVEKGYLLIVLGLEACALALLFAFIKWVTSPIEITWKKEKKNKD